MVSDEYVAINFPGYIVKTTKKEDAKKAFS